MTFARGPAVLAALGGVLLVLGCSAPDANERDELTVPPFEQFAPASEALSAHCGSLDCHGDVARNFRLYGKNGLRLMGALVPGGDPTTDAERIENYRSLVAIEPELTSQVFREKGAKPDRLTLIRKGRGTEHHKGGVAMTEGDATDACITSFLSGAVELDACSEAAEFLRPPDAP